MSGGFVLPEFKMHFWSFFGPKFTGKCPKMHILSLDPKLENNFGLLSSIFNLERPFQRYWGKKPHENAGMGENQPHWKTVKTRFSRKTQQNWLKFFICTH